MLFVGFGAVCSRAEAKGIPMRRNRTLAKIGPSVFGPAALLLRPAIDLLCRWTAPFV